MERVSFAENDPRFGGGVRLLGAGCRETMPPGFVSRRQGLDAWLCVLFHDKVQVELAGNLVEAREGTLILWDKRRPHYFGRPDCEWRHSWVVFTGSEWTRSDLLGLFEQPQEFEECAYLTSCFANLVREFEEFDRPDLPVLAAHIQLILREMVRGLALTREPQPPNDPVKLACKFVDMRLAHELSVNGLAGHVGLSPSRLQQLFRARLGCSVRTWIEGRRLQEVCYWLMHSGLRIGEIAERTGFSDGFYLTRRFTLAFGESPSAWRRKRFGAPPGPDALPRKN